MLRRKAPRMSYARDVPVKRHSSAGDSNLLVKRTKCHKGKKKVPCESDIQNKGFVTGSVSGGNSVYGDSTSWGRLHTFIVTKGLFQGRLAGGGRRDDVFGSSYYGSGYSQYYTTRDPSAGGPVGGLGFPYICEYADRVGGGVWPVYYAQPPYLGFLGSGELNDDVNRPGGAMTQYTLTPPSNITNTTANRFAIYGDANSVDSAYLYIQFLCGVTLPLASNFTINPNQAVQYYRGSSFALLLDGYNNSQPIVTNTNENGNTTTEFYSAAPPSVQSIVPGVDADYLACLNRTIGKDVALIGTLGGSQRAFGVHQEQILLILPALLMLALMNLVF